METIEVFPQVRYHSRRKLPIRRIYNRHALLVQLDRTPDYGSDDEDSSSSRGTNTARSLGYEFDPYKKPY